MPTRATGSYDACGGGGIALAGGEAGVWRSDPAAGFLFREGIRRRRRVRVGADRDLRTRIGSDSN